MSGEEDASLRGKLFSHFLEMDGVRQNTRYDNQEYRRDALRMYALTQIHNMCNIREKIEILPPGKEKCDLELRIEKISE